MRDREERRLNEGLRLGGNRAMALAAGTKLGAYEIGGLIGAGGMGEVYRARDTKLGREVAIKTLPSELAADKERVARFEREAKLLAALNHPHIAAVHGLDENEGTTYLAMELVEGETLERAMQRPMPAEDALRLALQIAEALEAAHDKGVVHRDLKPANIMVTPAGQVKVLDFGLAKAFAGDPNATMLANSPALSPAMTQQGFVLGTAGYMSPEQASGQATDQRADVWAFGVVLYEMLAGTPLFSGESVPHILADVLKTEPDWSKLPPNLHPRLKLLLERCLAKKPRNRLHSIADARVDLEAVLADPRGATPGSAVGAGPRPPRVLRVAGAVVATAAVAGAAGWLLRPVPAPEPKPIVRFSVPLANGPSLGGAPGSLITVSQDGTRIAYVADTQIFVRSLSDPEQAVQVTTETPFGATSPVFSPDGQWLAYVHFTTAQGPFTLKRVPISGGAPVPIHRYEAGQGFYFSFTWPTDDTIVAATSDGIVSIPANGGQARVLVARAEGERFESPQLLPGGEVVLFTLAPGTPGTTESYEGAQIVVQSVGGNDRTVVREGAAARYLSTGHLVYAQGATLFAVPFDPVSRVVRGASVPIVEGLLRSPVGYTDAANYAVADNGTLVMIPGDAGVGSRARVATTLVWFDREGREQETLPVRPDEYTAARISPDGMKVALVVGSHDATASKPPAIWIFDGQTQNLSLLTANGDDGPVWSSDSRRIWFRSARTLSAEVYSAELDTGVFSRVAASPNFPFALPYTITPDDRALVLLDALSLDNTGLTTLSLVDGEFAWLLNDRTSESEPALSPNGALLAYTERAAPGAPGEISLRPFPDVSRTRIPVGQGQGPVFSRDGSELFFFDGTGISAVGITYEPRIGVGPPRRLFETAGYIPAFAGRTWDVDPSGERASS